MGPKAGNHGGKIVAIGTPENIMKNKKSLTGQYLSHKIRLDINDQLHKGRGKFLTLVGARGNNLQDITVKFPLGIPTLKDLPPNKSAGASNPATNA